ncbi:hypothetical protein M1506_00005 [Patescibacteria group bacterium]|nr:hypothetical protein [Patescibacteria group bacterium]
MSIVIAFFLLILPGYFLSLFFPFMSGFFKRLAYSIILSLSLEVVLSFLLTVFNSYLIHYFLPATVAGVFILIVVLRFVSKKNLWPIVGEWKALSEKEKFFFWLVIVLSVCAGVLVFYPHFGYLWPIHTDEWWDITAVKSVLSGRPLNTNPYLLIPETDYKPGFTSLLAGFSAALGSDPVGFWTYLPSVNLFLISLVTSILLYDKTKNVWMGGLLPIFLAAIRSNAYVLGWWFFVPSSFALLFVLFILMSAKDFFESRKSLFLSLLIFASLGLVYLPFLGLVFISLVFFVPKLFKKFPIIFLAAVFFGAVSVAALLAASPYKSFWSGDVSNFLKSFFVPVKATAALINFLGFFEVVPLILFLLGVSGFIVLYKKDWSKSFLSGGIIGLLSILVIYFFGMSFLTFYQRDYYFFGVVVALLSSVGLGIMISEAKIWISLKWITVIVAVFAVFIGYFSPPPGTGLYYLVNKRDSEALSWLKNQKDLEGLYVLSNPDVGTIITPLSGLPAKMSWLTTQALKAQNNPVQFSFFSTTDCTVKKSIITELNASIVYGNSPQNCPFLKEIYNKDDVLIYRSML